MRTNRIIGVCAVLSWVALLVLRTGEEPRIVEAVDWVYASSVPSAASGPFLVDFSADWCSVCRELKLTTFRSDDFANFIQSRGLTPVRLSEHNLGRLEFWKQAEALGVGGIPALVVVDRSGRASSPIYGVLSVEQLRWRINRAFARMQQALHWRKPMRGGNPARDQDQAVIVREFSDWRYLEHDDRHDWRRTPTAAFADWASEHLVLVGDDYGLHMAGVDAYRKWSVTDVPTLVILDTDGHELGRFEGYDAVLKAPGHLSRLATDAGIALPEPPVPYAIGAEASPEVRED